MRRTGRASVPSRLLGDLAPLTRFLVETAGTLATNDVGALDIGHLDEVGENVTAFRLRHHVQLAEHGLDEIKPVGPVVVGLGLVHGHPSGFCRHGGGSVERSADCHPDGMTLRYYNL